MPCGEYSRIKKRAWLPFPWKHRPMINDITFPPCPLGATPNRVLHCLTAGRVLRRCCSAVSLWGEHQRAHLHKPGCYGPPHLDLVHRLHIRGPALTQTLCGTRPQIARLFGLHLKLLVLPRVGCCWNVNFSCRLFGPQYPLHQSHFRLSVNGRGGRCS